MRASRLAVMLRRALQEHAAGRDVRVDLRGASLHPARHSKEQGLLQRLLMQPHDGKVTVCNGKVQLATSLFLSVPKLEMQHMTFKVAGAHGRPMSLSVSASDARFEGCSFEVLPAPATVQSPRHMQPFSPVLMLLRRGARVEAHGCTWLSTNENALFITDASSAVLRACTLTTHATRAHPGGSRTARVSNVSVCMLGAGVCWLAVAPLQPTPHTPAAPWIWT
jgi:hypothetical protein